MKNLITILSMLLIMSTALASENRTSDIISDDSYDRLQKIKEIQTDLEKKEVALTAIEKELLKHEIKANNKKSSKAYITAGAIGIPVTLALAALGTKTGGGGILAALVYLGLPSSIAAVAIGTSRLYFSENDAVVLAERVRLLKVEIQKTNQNLDREIIQLCKVDSRHEICY